MRRVINIGNAPKEFMDDPEHKTKLNTLQVGKAVGCEKFYVNIDYVQPGARSTKYHTHSMQEEFFMILNGTGLLRMDGEEIPVRAGDVVSKPAGKGIAHQFINSGQEVLQILDVGTQESDDVAAYPDEDVIYVRNRGMAFRMEDKLPDWTSDPNS